MTRTPIEIATALKRLERYSPEIHPMVAEAAAMLREVAAMVEKLRGYASHKRSCDRHSSWGAFLNKCTCGLSELLQQSQPFDQQPSSAPTDVKP